MSTDKNNLVYQEQLDDNVIEMLSEDIGSNYSLRTENTKTIVAALNEILGKDIICNAVGSPLLTTDTFAELGEKINVMVSDFKAKLLGLGVSVSSVDKMAVMIEKIGEIDLGVDAEELLAPLEESLREILGDEGVELSGEETLAELIVKVDETFAEINERAESIRNTLVNLMINGGYNVDNNTDINSLLDLLVTSGIQSNEIKQVACGYGCTFILKNDGSVWSCGYNNKGQLGLNDTTNRNAFTQVTTNINNDVKQIACGYSHTIILKNDGSVWGCGLNANGQLGLGDTTDRTTFTQVTTNINNEIKQIVCGYGCTFILKNDGSVWSCGYNNKGQLGLNDTDNRTTFTQVTANINNDVKEVFCGYLNTFILKNDSSVYSCGNNSSGQLGLGNTTTYKTFTQVTTNTNNDVSQISCGYDHTFILKNDGSIWSCGDNNYGQLGLGNTTTYKTFTQVTTNINNDVKQIACGFFNTFIIKNDSSLWGCGSDNYGQLGLGNSTTSAFSTFKNSINDVKEIYLGNGVAWSGSANVCYNHVFIIKTDSSLWSCGYNHYGQLGLGTGIESYNSFNQVIRGF